MEMFGIMFSLPVAFGSSAIYSFFLFRFVKPRARLSKTLMAASLMVLSFWLIELVSVVFFGGARLSVLIGPAFYITHLVLFFLAVPSLATVMVLQPASQFLARWYFAAAICTFFALIVVLLQYGVSEAIFGIE